MRLTRDEKLWLLTANADTLALYDEAPDWLKKSCIAKGLVKPGPAAALWRLTESGADEPRALFD